MLRALAWVCAALLVLLALLSVLVVGALRTPAWWPAQDVSGDHTRAEAFENAAVSQLSSARPLAPRLEGLSSEPWSVVLNDADANAWLRTRLREWLRHKGLESRLPEVIETVGISTSPDGVRLGVRLSTGQVAWVFADARIDAQGALWIVPRGAGLGRTRLPVDVVLSRLGAIVSDDAAMSLRGDRPMLNEAAVSIDDARRVRLLGLEPRDGELVITARTEAKRAR